LLILSKRRGRRRNKMGQSMMFYPNPNRYKRCSPKSFAQIRKIKKKCEDCGKLATSICHSKIVCSKCYDKLKTRQRKYS
jgi:hypothetical protein